LNYLDTYGEGEEQRSRIIIRSIVSVIVLVIVVSLGWYLFKNHHQESIVRTFLGDVKRGDLEAGYRDWGCTSAKACSGYEFDKFQQDWGSQAKDGAPDPAILGIKDSESCGTGVLLTVAVNRERQEKLWVEKTSDAISFAPYPICPHKSPYAILIHRTVGQLRKPLL
jgi:hypothetical protein